MDNWNYYVHPTFKVCPTCGKCGECGSTGNFIPPQVTYTTTNTMEVTLESLQDQITKMQEALRGK